MAVILGFGMETEMVLPYQFKLRTVHTRPGLCVFCSWKWLACSVCIRLNAFVNKKLVPELFFHPMLGHYLAAIFCLAGSRTSYVSAHGVPFLEWWFPYFWATAPYGCRANGFEHEKEDGDWVPGGAPFEILWCLHLSQNNFYKLWPELNRKNPWIPAACRRNFKLNWHKWGLQRARVQSARPTYQYQSYENFAMIANFRQVTDRTL